MRAQRRRIAVRSLLFVLGCTVALGCGKRSGGTPNGTVLLAWTPAMSDRASFTKAVVKAKTTKDQTIRWTLDGSAGTVLIAARVDTGTAEIEEEGSTKAVQAPVAFTLTLTDNGVGATLETRCGGPHYQMPAAGPDGKLTTSPVMLTQCTVNAKYDSSNQILNLTLWGDGRLEPASALGSAKVE